MLAFKIKKSKISKISLLTFVGAKLMI